MNQERTPKETQGQRKMRQYLEDLMRNKEFLKLFKKLERTSRSKNSPERDATFRDQFNDLYQEYKNIEKELRRCVKRMKTVQQGIYNKMAYAYGLDNDLLQDIYLHRRLKDGEEILLNERADFCQVNDNNDVYDHVNWPAPPISVDFEKQRHIDAYPVRIDVHQLTTKRDLLDFVNKRWSAIEEYLRDINQKKTRLRKRKNPRKLVDFLWDNRLLRDSKLKEMLDMNFPKNNLVYHEFRKIIEGERVRRKGKLNVIR